MKKILFLISILVILSTLTSEAADDFKWAELRVFIANNTLSKEPTSFNNLTAADNVEKLKGLTGIGLEATGSYKGFKVGTKIKGIWNSVYPPNPPTPATAYFGVSQYTASGIARFPIANEDNFMFDAFAELGLGNTTLDIKTIGSGNSQFDKNANFFQRLGASVGFGSKSVKFYLEAGQEFNNVTDLKVTGSLGSNLTSIDLSGPYYSFGLIFNGVPSWITPGGITTK